MPPRLRVLAMAAVVAVLAAAGSCASLDHRWAAPGLDRPDPAHPWLVCDDQAEKQEVQSRITGGESAVLRLPGGHRLEVPDSALPAGETRTVIFRQLPTRQVAVSLKPSRSFDAPVTLVLSYGGRSCEVGQDSSALRLYRVRSTPPHDSLSPPRQGPAGPNVAATIKGFSVFAIAR